MAEESVEDNEPRFWDYMLPALRVLSDGRSRTSQELREATYDSMGLTDEQRAYTHAKSGQRRVDVRANFAIHHLRRATAIEGGYGVAQITELGRQLLADHPDSLTRADLEEIQAYREYVPQRETPAEAGADDEIGVQSAREMTAWFVGARFDDPGSATQRDHSMDFIAQGRWEIHPDSSAKLKAQVMEMRAGDRIAIKSVYVRSRQAGVPFRTNGHPVSVMAIKAAGTIMNNPGTGLVVDVTWDQDLTAEPREWFLYTYQGTIWRVVPDTDRARNLVEFAFEGADQDLDTLRNLPFWRDRFGDDAAPTSGNPDLEHLGDDESTDESSGDSAEPVYTVESIIEDGCFLREDTLENLLRTLAQKKNLILQGPPGTGKTWLAKRLARALVQRDHASLVTAVQFHPTVSYEDFVRGWRPSGDGRLELVDGTLLQIAERAAATPDQDHVLVVEEINRGNLAQIFGEMLTLLEADKRTADQAMHLTYRRPHEAPFHLPDNLYLIGTMNLADRSLAMVDFALRRRFGFADLQPEFNLSWATWVTERVTGASQKDVERVGTAVEELNKIITKAPGLGEQYRIGHSFFTPAKTARNVHFVNWATTVIGQEIRPLLHEYWFDQPERVENYIAGLMDALPVSD
ncbi:AAA family ATPase [Nesterenkonia sandarakina]|uniref:5-methylcytosine-specific restriction protein B n=1 Tax=Nesterenkonia sandarakina TaxID=272918 RepID=A0A2T0YK85_9MICC|nr:AAA family ATPase [Nesterenkonia sandarakina]PRZ15611.1 5-methylcytosine-specific restriction protein B [Nesterenkonia sandarakina]